MIQGYDVTDATITRVPGTGSDILIDFGGGDSIEVRGTLTGGFFTEIETITFDGPGTVTSFTSADLRHLLADQEATAGDDVIIGTSATDTLEGGLGDDFLSGQGSGDQYLYTFGDGHDTIWDRGGGSGDEVVIDGILSSDVTFERAADNLDTVIMTFAGGGSIRLEGSLNGSFSFGIETVTFNADSTSFTMPQLRDILTAQTATSGNEDILGWSTADTLFSGAGDDVLSGFASGDTYVFDIGDGDDVVDDNGGGNGDEIIFNDRDSTDATFSALVPGSDDLLIEFANGDSVIVIDGTTSSFVDRIEEFVFDDVTLMHGDVLLLL